MHETHPGEGLTHPRLRSGMIDLPDRERRGVRVAPRERVGPGSQQHVVGSLVVERGHRNILGQTGADREVSSERSEQISGPGGRDRFGCLVERLTDDRASKPILEDPRRRIMNKMGGALIGTPERRTARPPRLHQHSFTDQARRGVSE